MPCGMPGLTLLGHFQDVTDSHRRMAEGRMAQYPVSPGFRQGCAVRSAQPFAVSKRRKKPVIGHAGAEGHRGFDPDRLAIGRGQSRA